MIPELATAVIPAAVTVHNRSLDHDLRPTMDLKRWKLLKGLLTTLGILAFAGYAIESGAEPTTVATLSLLLAGLINGVDLVELAAVWADVREEHKDPREDDRE